MRSFQHVENPLRIHAGDDCLGQIGRELSRLGAARAVIVCGGTIARSSALDVVREGMGGRCAGVYGGVKAHTPRSGVAEAAGELRRPKADAVVAIGGGSAVVTARAATIFLSEGDDLDALCSSRDGNGRMRSPKLDSPKIPQLVVPTTPNTAMVKAGSAVFDEAANQRKALFDPKTRSQAVFLHPDFLMSAPAKLVVSSSLDTLTLSLEGLLSKAGDAIADALLMHAVRVLVADLPRVAARDSADLRNNLAMAAIMGGRGTDHAGAGAATVLGHAIGAQHDVENGIAKCVVLPHVLRFNAAHAQAGLAKVVAALGLGLSVDAVDAINATFDRLFHGLGVPRRLRDLGILREALPAIAVRGMDDWFLQGNPRPIAEPHELVEIMTAAW
jgi:alcohol dehydrogenase class IV